MGKTLTEIAQQLNTPQPSKKIEKIKSPAKVQLIYAFNGVGKTRLSREFKKLVAPKSDNKEGKGELPRNKILYYNAFTEDLFYWDNDLDEDTAPTLKIQPNSFTDWVLRDQGQDQNIITTFQHYTNDKLTPRFNENFSEVSFSLERGNNEDSENIKISKGEESCFVWSIFYSLMDQVVDILNIAEPERRDTHEFDHLEYIFIDDPVSSLDENHLIELAIDLAQLIKSSKSELKFIITTHNTIFYNVLHNELKSADKYQLKVLDDVTYDMAYQSNDSPFSYHLYLKSELEKAIENGQLKKYHFNFIRNILEKTSTFLGHETWGYLLEKTNDGRINPYETRIINISSHSKYANEEVADLTDNDKLVLRRLAKRIDDIYHLRQPETENARGAGANMHEFKPVMESNNFIVLEKYDIIQQIAENYQSESDLERELIQDLQNQGYEYLPALTTPEQLLVNVREQLQALNDVRFSEDEWMRFVAEWLDKPSDGIIEKTRKIHDDYIYDFVFDDGHIQNIYLLDKKNIARNKVQVINQLEQTGLYVNRYDVTILVNGLPLVQVELKKRGVAIREAFNQIHRYSKESFNSDHSLFKYLQLFVISNGTDTRYFANTTKRGKNSFDFTMNWAKADNSLLKDLKDFTATFFQKDTLLKVLLHYSVFDVSNTLLVMRPYQIAATERILWKINSSYQAKTWSKPESGGYIWHTTGSGKTLTSFKAARLATELDFIDKVFFVVDRKDLDYQTMKEYQRFSPDSVNGSESTAGLKRNLDRDDNKIIVTTIQKLNNLMKSEADLPIYGKQVVFIFDECHRSQFGEAQGNLKKKFKRYYQFGFTGTPIFPENALGAETTAGVFGRELHSYVITDAIRDEKVLKFKVDYNDVRPLFKALETERDEKKLSTAENGQALLHPERIREVTQYILHNFRQKTHRLQMGAKGFNAMFAVSSVDAAKLYYETFKELQSNSSSPLKVATIFSFAANEEQDAIGDIRDESFDATALDTSDKEFLSAAIADYNALFKTNFSVEGNSFQNYYRDLAQRVKKQEVDLLIVVGMFLTGFDAPTLNTLFVDKNLRYHGLMQAYSRTNRIFDATKTFGNIITFRDLEQATIDAITLFGDKNTKNVLLEKSYKEYMEGFTDAATGEARRGFVDVVKELEERFPDPAAIETETDKKAFVKLFGEYLRIENVLQNYDEFASLKALQNVNMEDPAAVEAFKVKHYLNDEDVVTLRAMTIPPERKIQDYRSAYNDVREWLRREKSADSKEKSTVNWDDIVFEIDLLKSQEINLDYILELLFENNKKIRNKPTLIEDIRRVIRSSLGSRAKESLLVDFINTTDLDQIEDKASVIDAFFTFAQAEQRREAHELISTENLNAEAAKRYITTSLKHEFASENGTELNAILPKMSPLNPLYLTKKQSVFQRIVAFIEKFKGVGGKL